MPDTRKNIPNHRPDSKLYVVWSRRAD